MPSHELIDEEDAFQFTRHTTRKGRREKTTMVRREVRPRNAAAVPTPPGSRQPTPGSTTTRTSTLPRSSAPPPGSTPGLDDDPPSTYEQQIESAARSRTGGKVCAAPILYVKRLTLRLPVCAATKRLHARLDGAAGRVSRSGHRQGGDMGGWTAVLSSMSRGQKQPGNFPMRRVLSHPSVLSGLLP